MFETLAVAGCQAPPGHGEGEGDILPSESSHHGEPTTRAASSVGCYADSWNRDLPYLADESESNTNERCIAACRNAGYAFAGTQYSTQCFCGNAYGSQGPSDGCELPCAGDASEACGGNWANSVFATAGGGGGGGGGGPAPIRRAGSYFGDLPWQAEGYTYAPGQNVIRMWSYIWPKGTWTGSSDYGVYASRFQPWIDLAANSRTDDAYVPQFDFDEPNPDFYDGVRAVVEDARAHGSLVFIILFQGSQYDGDAWTYNPLRAGNNVNGIGAGSYDELNSNPSGAVRDVLIAYVQRMIDTFGGYDNVSFEIMNEGDPDSDAWQEQLVGYIHDHSSIKTMRSSLYPAHSDLGDPNDPLVRTRADAISPGIDTSAAGYSGCWGGPPDYTGTPASAYPDVTQFGKPVYLDTDHNCAGGTLTPEQIDGLYCRGYNLLQLIAGTSADAELARIGACATDPSQCPSCP